ncbi:MAG: tetratricopeptide repeat protein [Candidatus Melainabacteria bacterium]|nr:tetratricopeptide repeat protein [Candidatus Melainabacteria bacterium]
MLNELPASEQRPEFFQKEAQSQSSFATAFNQANIYKKLKDNAKAAEAVRQAAGLARKASQLRACGQLMVTLGRVKEALPLYEKAIKLNPNDPHAYLDVCHASRLINDNATALKAANKALLLSPDLPAALCFRATVFIYMDNFEAAKRDLAAVESQKAPMDAFTNMSFGLVNMHLGDPKGAAKYLARATKQNPDFYPPHSLLINIYTREKNWEMALHELDECLRLQPDQANLLKDRGQVLLHLERERDALLDISRAIQLEPSSAHYYIRALHLYRNDREIAALRDCTSGISAGKSDRTKLLKLRANCYRNLQDAQHELLDLTDCIKIKPDANVFERRFKVLMSLGKKDLALKDIDEAIKLKDTAAEYHFLRGDLKYQSRKYQEALKDFKRACELEPDDERFQLAKKKVLGDLNASPKEQK